MHRLFYILAATLIALLSWPLVPAQAGAEEWGGIEGTQSEYTQIASDGSPGFIWPPGGVAPVGHLEGTPRRFTPVYACASPEPVIHVIELSAVSGAAVNEFWFQMMRSGECKEFPDGLRFWPDEVVAEMKWGDGDPMYVVKGHDNTGFASYTWIIASRAKALGVPPPGSSELIPLI